MENVKTPSIKFYCPEHNKGFEVESGAGIYCQSGKHRLALEFPPTQEYLEYCCGCQTFIPFSITGKSKKQECLRCENEIENRYFCHQCQTLAIDVRKKIDDKKFIISVEGKISPNCPACNVTTNEETLHLHECKTLKTSFYTSRTRCVFCLKNVFQTYESRIKKLEERLSLYEFLSSECKSKTVISGITEEIKNLKGYINNIYSYLIHYDPKLIELNSGKLSELTEISKKLQNLDKKVDFVVSNSFPNIKLNELGNLIPPKIQKSQFDSDYELLQGLVSEVQDRFDEKAELTKHPYVGALKSITSESETTTYYRVSIGTNENLRNYAIPAATKINSSAEAYHLSDFYSLIQSHSNLTGNLKINKPAEIKWNEEIKAWQLVEKGLIKIES